MLHTMTSLICSLEDPFIDCRADCYRAIWKILFQIKYSSIILGIGNPKTWLTEGLCVLIEQDSPLSEKV